MASKVYVDVTGLRYVVASLQVYCIWQLNEPEKHPLLPRK